jgi:hypothetical protein
MDRPPRNPQVGHKGSHNFYDGRCINCDCRPWGNWATWPCNNGWHESADFWNAIAAAAVTDPEVADWQAEALVIKAQRDARRAAAV